MQGLKIAELFATLTIDDRKFKESLSRAHKAMGGISKGVGVAGRALYGIGRVGAAAFGALAAGAAVAVRAASKQETEFAKLRGVVEATGRAAGFSAEQMAEQATQLQNVTAYADDAVMQAQAVIATFKEVKGDHFVEATESALDLATVIGVDVKTAAIQLGKALNDPVRGMVALRRSGVSFTEQQQKMVKRMMRTNDIIGAQRIILDELQNEFGGTAREIGTSFAGSITRAQNKMGDFIEDIGARLAPGIQGFADNIDVPLAALDKLTGGFVSSREAGAEWAHWLAEELYDVQARAKQVLDVFEAIGGLLTGGVAQIGALTGSPMLGGLTGGIGAGDILRAAKAGSLSPMLSGPKIMGAESYAPRGVPVYQPTGSRGGGAASGGGELPIEFLRRIDANQQRLLDETRKGPYR